MKLALPPPEGFSYHPDVLDNAEEESLLALARTLPLEEMRFHGFVARRRTAHFGWVYSFDGVQLEPGPPIPAPLVGLRDRVARLAGQDPALFEEALVTEYPPGATIGWHRDARPFGPVVLGVSLGSTCRFRLRPRGASAREAFTQELAPRSAYVIAGPARTEWEHQIPPVKETRFSISFRTLARRPSSVAA
ncbi:alpha-ketoglutarate-dependent dioxygenase AlkB [Polyangium aurulentum]|uniref:alpha-ketoglutarate-dependent dioxygenase AlkB n=1 Tax=Polyangium aurulentum TaxID=2567896 RepID=UPI0010AE2A83|nr:alpha-ketoglutarate-dependent dioxygenase AlkB [Polyangium aurulentum]UQA55397.1 alpha-ketoglutarate-dependent dioxygenase AlkB [Polyangium aurulentum]